MSDEIEVLIGKFLLIYSADIYDAISINSMRNLCCKLSGAYLIVMTKQTIVLRRF